MDELPMSARIIGLADTFDAMTSARPYREPLSVGGTLSEIVRLAPLKYDPAAVQGLLIQMRRESVGSHRTKLLDERMAVNIAPADIDQLAASLQHKLTRGRVMTLPPSQIIDS
jgi:HD-GYP domain-containing protein (c-di-GMP phosphodiesterase class II)